MIWYVVVKCLVACKRAFAVGVLMRQKKVVGEIGVKRRV